MVVVASFRRAGSTGSTAAKDGCRYGAGATFRHKERWTGTVAAPKVAPSDAAFAPPLHGNSWIILVRHYSRITHIMRGVQYLILRFGLFFFFALITCPIALAAVLMVEFCDKHEQFKILRWPFLAVCLAWLFGLPWLTSRAAQHMAFEDRKFGEAVKCAFYDLRLRLAFLPVIGHWFESKSQDDDDRDA